MKILLTMATIAAIGFGISVTGAQAQRIGNVNDMLPAARGDQIADNLVQVHRKHKPWKRYSNRHFRKHHRYAFHYYYNHHTKLRKKHRKFYRHHRYNHRTYSGFVPLIHLPGPNVR